MHELPATEIPLPYVATLPKDDQSALLVWLGSLDPSTCRLTLEAYGSVKLAPHVVGGAVLNWLVQAAGLFSRNDPGTTLRHYALRDGAAYTADYKARDGCMIPYSSAPIGRLDWLLENRLHEAFESADAEEHWDEPGAMLPAGPGPHRSGFVALGGVGMSRQEPDMSVDEQREKGAPAWRTECWREVPAFNECLDHCARVNSRNYVMLPGFERQLQWQYADATEFQHALERQRGDFRSACTTVLQWLDENVFCGTAQFFVGAHAAWDRFDEDPLGRDHVAAITWADGVYILHRMLARYYG